MVVSWKFFRPLVRTGAENQGIMVLNDSPKAPILKIIGDESVDHTVQNQSDWLPDPRRDDKKIANHQNLECIIFEYWKFQHGIRDDLGVLESIVQLTRIISISNRSEPDGQPRLSPRSKITIYFPYYIFIWKKNYLVILIKFNLLF